MAADTNNSAGFLLTARFRLLGVSRHVSLETTRKDGTACVVKLSEEMAKTQKEADAYAALEKVQYPVHGVLDTWSDPAPVDPTDPTETITHIQVRALRSASKNAAAAAAAAAAEVDIVWMEAIPDNHPIPRNGSCLSVFPIGRPLSDLSYREVLRIPVSE